MLEAFERDQAGRAVHPEDVIERLIGHGFMELRGGQPLLTSRGRMALTRRRSLDRKTRK